MFRMISALAIASAFFCVSQAAPAHAQATRTWVSGVGDDANPCSRTAPCKTFAGAISKTARGGEIAVLDPGGYGGVTITKSISIIGESGEAGIVVAGTNGITINIDFALNPTDPGVVNFHNIFLEGLGSAPTTPGINGIQIKSAKSVNIQNCLIRGFKTGNGAGIDVNPSTTNVAVMVSNTSINSNVRGIRVKSDGAGTAKVMLDRVNINNVALGAVVGANSTLYVSNSTIFGANSAFVPGGNGKIISFGNNSVAGNNVPAADNPSQIIDPK